MSFRSLFSSFVYSPQILLSEQFNFGHREVILAANNLPANFLFMASLQHGWTYKRSGTPVIRDRFLRGYPNLVWSQRIAQDLKDNGMKNYKVSGAPWSHLLRACAIDPREPKNLERKSTKLLFFPNHSLPGALTPQNSNIAQIGKRYNASEITVCLFWMDYIDPSVQDFYSQFDCKLMCVGYRGSSGFETPWAPVGGRNLFMTRLLQIIDDHDVIGFETVMTPLWYAITLGKSFFVCNHREELRVWRSQGYSNVTVSYSDDNVGLKMNLPNFHFGELIQPNDDLFEFALAEVGWDESKNFIQNVDKSEIFKVSEIDEGLVTPVVDFITEWKLKKMKSKSNPHS